MDTTLNSFLKKPPKLVSEIGYFIKDVMPHVVGLNKKFDDPLFLQQNKPLLTLMSRCAVELLDVIIRHFKAFFDYHSMSVTGPMNCTMGIIVIMECFFVIIEDRVDDQRLKPWQLLKSAKELPYCVKHKLCVDDKAIKSYTHDQLIMALYVLSVRWYSLGQDGYEDLETYLLGLLHRMCIVCISVDEKIVSIVNDDGKNDMDSKDKENEVFKIAVARTRMCMQIVKMLYLLRFGKDMERGALPPADEIKRQIDHMRQYSSEKIRILSKAREAKTEIYSMFPKMLQLHGDIEVFMNARGMENARPNSLLMTVRSEGQQAMTQLHQFVIIKNVQAEMKDDDANYFKKYTRYEHNYMLILKTYMVNMMLKDPAKTDRKASIDFFKDYIVYELDIFDFADRFMKEHEPVLVQLFGKFHVYFDYKLYICTCVEMAIFMWARIVLERLGGKLQSTDISIQLKQMLGIRDPNNITQMDALSVSGETALNIITEGKIVVD